MNKSLILAAVVSLGLTSPVAATQWYRLDQVEGTAPARVIHVFNLDAAPSPAGGFKISMIDLFETPRKDHVARIDTEAVINCTAKTLETTFVQHFSDNRAPLGATVPKGAARRIKAGTPEDKFRAALCDGSKDGLVAVSASDLEATVSYVVSEMLRP